MPGNTNIELIVVLSLTAWENDIPSRIDLSKHKYGGPFTNEQVEDVKTLLQLLILILSLLGFQLSGDGFSLSQPFSTVCLNICLLFLYC